MNRSARIHTAIGLLALAAPAAAQVEFSFQRTDYLGGVDPVAVAVGTLDGDAFPDIAYAAQGTGRIVVLLNQGDGSFGPAKIVAAANVFDLALGHVSNDGLLDMVGIDVQGRLIIWRGFGNGAFATPTVIQFPNDLISVGLAHLNDPFFEDILVTMGAPTDTVGELLVIRNVGGTYTTVQTLLTDGPSPGSVVGELNGDLFPDVISFSFGTGRIHLGQAGGVFDTRPLDFPDGFGGGPIWIDLADLDEDGVLDAVATIRDFGGDAELSIFEGLGDGHFDPIPSFETTTNPIPAFPSTGDFNGDGLADVVAQYTNVAQGLAAFGGDGRGNVWPSAVTATGNDLRALAVADLDLDGRDDVVMVDAGLDVVSVLLAQQDEELSSYGDGFAVLTPFNKTQHLALQLTPTLGGALYWVLGSATGTAPGLPLGAFTLPLNFDGYTQFTIDNPGTLIQNSLGLLNDAGAGNATWFVPGAQPLSPSLAGVTLNHAFLVIDPDTLGILYISDAVSLALQ